MREDTETRMKNAQKCADDYMRQLRVELSHANYQKLLHLLYKEVL